MLTFSFLVKKADVVKCYLYWNGQMIRFMPQDICTVLPKIFNMGFRGNKAFLKDEDNVGEIVHEMQCKMRDKKFEAFRSSF